ncbi:class I SAM-dependent methyltransferase [Litorilituus sediminis]|uniref:Histidine kinase n=1 Tax=Litorilituus sediminis TaxID=718192 RepID=A0A4P6P6A0_9GAMM|nr:histidine kinase [Litorilituus sediminis]QBG34967.1 histidine kinase [Litorilituus sediminis]
MTSVRLKYQTIEFGKTDIHLCGLRNKQEFSDPEKIAEKLGISSSYWPIFGLLWPSSIVLADYLLEFDTDRKRILEVGCGLALSSLLLNSQGNDITATDHHPEVDGFLKRNTLLNNDPDIPFERVDWADEKDSLGLYDLIIGSDLLYEDEHIELLANFFNNHAQKACEVILVDPSRGRKSKLIQKLESFGFESSILKVQSSQKLPDDYKGFILSFKR